MGSKRDLKASMSQLLRHADKPAEPPPFLTFGINTHLIDIRMVLQKRFGLGGCQDRH
jgi:hypothetical protein